MEYPLNITALNDYIFCPVSIYFHNLYGEMERSLYQTSAQINGTHVHSKIDEGSYSTSSSVKQGLEVYSSEYNLIGKIDLFDVKKSLLTERKKKVSTIYDGYIFQLYAQYFALKEMGYEVKYLRIHSYDDNKNYDIPLPEKDNEMYEKFKEVIESIRAFNPEEFEQTNRLKCCNCIYEPYCDRSLL